MRKTILLFTLIFSLILAFSLNISATDLMLSEYEARAYLDNFSETEITSSGNEITHTYSFENENDYNISLNFIMKNGIQKYEELLNVELEKCIENTEITSNNFLLSRIPTNGTNYNYLSKSGLSSVSIIGTMDFGKLGDGQYRMVLSYYVGIANGKIISMGTPSLTQAYLTGGCELVSTSIPSNWNSTFAAATGNFTIQKTLYLPGPFPVGLQSAQDTDGAALFTYVA